MYVPQLRSRVLSRRYLGLGLACLATVLGLWLLLMGFWRLLDGLTAVVWLLSRCF